jgi:hypothetical protein
MKKILFCLVVILAAYGVFATTGEVSIGDSIKNNVVGIISLAIVVLLLTAAVSLFKGLSKKVKVPFLKAIIDDIIDIFLELLEIVQRIEKTERKEIKGKLTGEEAKKLHNNAYNEFRKRNKTFRTITNVVPKEIMDNFVNRGIESIAKRLKF